MLRAGGAHLAAERSEEERSGAKRRGHGLGPRNTIKNIDNKQTSSPFSS